MLLIMNKDFICASPIPWKTKQVERVCHPSKDPDTLTLNKLVEDVVFAARQIETLLCGNHFKRRPIHLYTEPEGTLESIVSTRQIERKSLCI